VVYSLSCAFDEFEHVERNEQRTARECYSSSSASQCNIRTGKCHSCRVVLLVSNPCAHSLWPFEVLTAVPVRAHVTFSSTDAGTRRRGVRAALRVALAESKHAARPAVCDTQTRRCVRCIPYAVAAKEQRCRYYRSQCEANASSCLLIVSRAACSWAP
jgi:hypothetical protein